MPIYRVQLISTVPANREMHVRAPNAERAMILAEDAALDDPGAWDIHSHPKYLDNADAVDVEEAPDFQGKLDAEEGD